MSFIKKSLLSLGLLSGLVMSSSAFSEVTLCNKSETYENVKVAVGFFLKGHRKPITIGWYKIAKNDCRSIVTVPVHKLNLANNYMYVSIKSDNNDGLPAFTWPGRYELCADNNRDVFAFRDATNCSQAQKSQFARIRVKGTSANRSLTLNIWDAPSAK